MKRRDNDLVHIDRDRYRELKYFCYQYNKWQEEIQEIKASLSAPGVNYDGMPHGTGVSFPTEKKAIRIFVLERKISCVEKAASMASKELAPEILWYCTNRDVSFADLEVMGIPCSRATFDRHRALFFRHLSMLIDGEE